MKKFIRILVLLFVLVTLAACDRSSSKPKPEKVDYGKELKLDLNSSRAKTKATVLTFIDGDTTHFSVDDSVISGGVLRARYLAVDTPESTGDIEEWGKTASNFTKEKLENAVEIYVEAKGPTWKFDSTGSRYLAWVWYKPSKNADFRCVNLELLQEGLAKPKNLAGLGEYGEICQKAYDQARELKVHMFSDEKDKNFDYGDARNVTIKAIRDNIEKYVGKKVRFEGLVTKIANKMVYVQDFDAESGINYGLPIYLGYSSIEIVKVGNKLSIVGNVTKYQDSYQVSGLKYNPYLPDNSDNVKLISEDNPVVPKKMTAEEYKTIGGKVISTYVAMDDLQVKNITVTKSDKDSSNGAMTLTCSVGGDTVIVRTAVLHNEDGTIVTKETFEGKTLDVKGIVDIFMGKTQIRLFSLKDVTIH